MHPSISIKLVTAKLIIARRGPMILGIALISLLWSGCGPTAALDPLGAAVSPDRINVVATNTVLADLARQVAGDLAEVVSIIPAAADAHAFQATPSDSKAIAVANVIILNGMGFDDFLKPILESGRRGDAVNVVVTSGLDLSGTSSDESTREGRDPHLWLNPVFAADYVVRIRDGLILADPDHTAGYMSNADAYLEQLRALDQEIAETLKQVPPQRRNLVSYHDAFSHFGDRYGWETTSLVPHDASDSTPDDIVRVMARIVEDGIPAVFIEPQLESAVMRAAAQDAGAVFATIRTLVDDNAPTYIAMMRGNTQSLVDNLR